MKKPKTYDKLTFKDVACSKCGETMKISTESVEGICWRCVCDFVKGAYCEQPNTETPITDE